MLSHLIHFLAEHLLLSFFSIAGSFVLWKIIQANSHQKNAQKLLDKAIRSNANEPLTLHPKIDASLCAGCGACTKVCPEGDILQLINHKAVLVGPTKCVGHGDCERACPVDAITLVIGTKARGVDIPRVKSTYETNVPGLYIAGELGGMGLIRNAIKQGIIAAQNALNESAKIGEAAQYDVIIVGAGPAGLAAALVAIAQKKKYYLIEQDKFGGAVANYPRQKIVMTHPFELPMFGKKKFASNKVLKEELIAYWTHIRQKTGLKVQENTQFKGLKKSGNIFHMETNNEQVTARKVILAMGVRGTPRKLGVPGEEKSKVTYNLLDPEQYQQKRIVVVGGGNAGVEAAQMLGDPKWGNRVHLLIRGASLDRCNEDNMQRIFAMEKKKQVTIWYNSSIQEIQDKTVTVQKESQLGDLKNDYVFVFAGAEMPGAFLMSLGVAIDKKHGEALGKAS